MFNLALQVPCTLKQFLLNAVRSASLSFIHACGSNNTTASDKLYRDGAAAQAA